MAFSTGCARARILPTAFLFLLASLLASAPWAQLAEIGSPAGFVRFAAIGFADLESEDGRKILARVRSWTPEFVVALGDGGYPGEGAQVLAWASGEGRQDYARGSVHLFSLGGGEQDRAASREASARWLRQALAESRAPWKIVYFGEGSRPSAADVADRTDPVPRWPFKEWGADAVMSRRDGIYGQSGQSGHYERLEMDGLTYFIHGHGSGSGTPAGPGGSPERPAARAPGSRSVFNEEQGAMLIEAGPGRIDFRFVTADGLVVDAHTLRKQGLAERMPGEGGHGVPVGTRSR